MAVCDQDIQPAIVIHVKKSRAPPNVRIAGLADTRSPTDVVESLGSHVAVEGVGLFLEMCHEKAEAAAMVVIAPINAHISKFHALAAQSHAGEQTYLFERSVVFIVVEIIWYGIVGHQQIGPAVVIIVYPHDAQAIIANVIMHSRLHGNFFKRPVALIVIEKIAFALEPPGSALHQDAFESAEFVAAKLR